MYDVLRQGDIFMPEFYISKIILHRFHVDNNEDESGIVYDMVIGRDLMVQLGLLSDFTLKVLNRMVIQYQ